MGAFPPADFKEVIKPNFDTLYSSAWLNLIQEPPVFKPDPSVDMKAPPMLQVNQLPADKYFAMAANLMAVNPAD